MPTARFAAALRDLRRDGPKFLFLKAAFKIANTLTYCVAIEGMTLRLAAVDPSFFEDDGVFRHRFFGPGDFTRYGASADIGLDAAFLREAKERGDRCYVFLHGDTIASYGWYSTKPIGLGLRGHDAFSDPLQLYFDSSYVYMYSGFTRPEYRGRRLHGKGMAAALRAYSNRGLKGIISYVEASNRASLRSCDHLGYERFGRIYAVRLFGKYFVHCTPGCHAHRFEVKQGRHTSISGAPPMR